MKNESLLEWYRNQVETKYPGKGQEAVELVLRYADPEFRELLRLEKEEKAYIARPDSIVTLCRRVPELLQALRSLK